MKTLINRICIGVFALMFATAGMAASVTVTPATANPALNVIFLVTISGQNFVEDLVDPNLDQTTIGATLGLSLSANLEFVGPVVQCPTTSGTNCPASSPAFGTDVNGAGLPASGPFSTGSAGAYNPTWNPIDPTPNTPPPGGSTLTSFTITTNTGASGNFDVLKLAIRGIAAGPGTITLVDNGTTLTWFQINDPFDVIPVTYTQGAVCVDGPSACAPVIPVPAAVWLMLSGLGALAGLKRLRRQ